MTLTVRNSQQVNQGTTTGPGAPRVFHQATTPRTTQVGTAPTGQASIASINAFRGTPFAPKFTSLDNQQAEGAFQIDTARNVVRAAANDMLEGMYTQESWAQAVVLNGPAWQFSEGNYGSGGNRPRVMDLRGQISSKTHLDLVLIGAHSTHYFGPSAQVWGPSQFSQFAKDLEQEATKTNNGGGWKVSIQQGGKTVTKTFKAQRPAYARNLPYDSQVNADLGTTGIKVPDNLLGFVHASLDISPGEKVQIDISPAAASPGAHPAQRRWIIQA